MKRRYLLIGILLTGGAFLLLGISKKSEKPKTIQVFKTAVAIQDSVSIDTLMDGDIIFQVNVAGQGLAIQHATHSRYTHVGILFKNEEGWQVYEAVEPVRISTLESFIESGDNGHYVIKRLNNRNKLLPDSAIGKMRDFLDQQLGKHYDLHFGWDDERMYCSELVWKCYQKAGIQIGKLKKLKEFDLHNPVVKQLMYQRYGKNVPMNETVISPADIFEDENLHLRYDN